MIKFNLRKKTMAKKKKKSFLEDLEDKLEMFREAGEENKYLIEYFNDYDSFGVEFCVS